MGDVIVIQFCTLDGVVSDPDGRGGTTYGGWAFRHGAGPVTDDKFRLGERMENGIQLYGRRTWEAFAKVWPQRDGDYAKVMNTVPKMIASRTGLDPQAWPNSRVIDGEAVDWVRAERERRDIVVIGSLSLVRQLATARLVDEYRLITFPTVLGEGDRLFDSPGEFQFTSVEQAGAATLTVLRTCL